MKKSVQWNLHCTHYSYIVIGLSSLKGSIFRKRSIFQALKIKLRMYVLSCQISFKNVSSKEIKIHRV
jgi:hypothetical protein